MNVQSAPLANPCTAVCGSEWAAGEPGRALKSWTEREARAAHRWEGRMMMSAQRDKHILADRPTGTATAFAQSPEPKEGMMRTQTGPTGQQRDHKVIFHPVCPCVCVSVLCRAFSLKSYLRQNIQ